jgi:hypothetical protein
LNLEIVRFGEYTPRDILSFECACAIDSTSGEFKKSRDRHSFNRKN